ncbi:MAG: hypothetical protein WC532_04170 [Candidatus Omnitrophota bacterium]
MLKENGISKLILALAIIAAFAYVVFLQFLSPVLYDPDSYYHIAVSGFIRNHGLRYPFHWAQFSVFKDAFSDKDILFHILNLPFLFLSDNPVTAGKYAFIFQAAIFFFVYLFILKKYLTDRLAAVFLLLPLTSSVFTTYLLQLRPATLANSLMLLGIYFLINKKPAAVFVTVLLYSLSHVSFFMLIVFAFSCETIRQLTQKEFFAKNIYLALAGAACGLLLHPNFPHNLFSQYLNGIVVQLYAFRGAETEIAGELLTLNTKSAVIANFTVFFSLNLVLWLAFTLKRKAIGFTTAVWFSATSIYLFLAFFGNRYWYQANILFFVFFASCVNDWLKNKNWKGSSGKLKLTLALYLAAVIALSLPGMKQLKEFIDFSSARSSRFEETGRWMQKNIPAGQTIYHSYWNDSPYFICLNPKDNYLNCLDPIYMSYRYPRESELLNELRLGRVDKPYVAIRKIFKSGYAYLNKFEPLYRQALEYPRQFKILYTNSEGAVFELLY